MDLVDEEACADGVKAAGSDEDRVARLRGNRMHAIGDAAVFDGLFEVRLGHPVFQADVKFRAGIAVGDVPHLGLRFAAELCGKVHGRVDLDREVVAGVEHFDEDRETRVVFVTGAEELLAAGGPEFVQRGAGERSFVDNGLLVLAVHNFPRLAEGLCGIG